MKASRRRWSNSSWGRIELMHRDSIIAVGADAGALAQRVAVRLVERMNARPGGFALNLSGGSRRSSSTGSWPPTGTILTRPTQ
jgi:hypothetical protein